MKTAMELALARIEMLYIEKDSVHWEMFKNDCVEKEKYQIMNAHCSGWQKGKFNENNDWLNYYNEIYNQNK